MRVLLAACALVVAQGAHDLASLERAVAADPENLHAAAEYRLQSIAAADFDRPIVFLEKLAKRKDAGPNVQISLALAYVDKVPASGDIRRLYLGRDAINALDKAIERQPTVLAFYVRGQINLYYNNFIFKRIPRGIEDLTRALTLVTPQTLPALVARVHTSIGDGYWRLEDRAKAVEVWRTAAATFPDDAELKRRLDPDAGRVRWVVSDALNASTRLDTTLRGLVP